MYFDLLSAAAAAQKAVSDAYNASGRERGTGVYFVVINHTTTEFFKTLTPEPELAQLHGAFLGWLTSGGLAITEELELGQPVDSQLARDFVRAGKRFADEMESFVNAALKP